MILRLLVVSILAPAIAAAAVAAAVRGLPEGSWLRRAVASPALMAGYAAGHLAVAGLPSFPPVDTTQGLFYLAVAVGLLGLAEAGPGRPWVSPIARVLAIGLTLGLSLHPLVRYQWTAGEAAVRLAALGVATLGLWWVTRIAAPRLPEGAGLAAWTAVFAGTAVLLLLARTALLAQLASMIAIALIALALPLRGREAPSAIAGALPFLIPMLYAFAINGFFYTGLGAVAAMALAASPLAAVAAVALANRRGPRVQAVAAVLGVVILLAPLIARAAVGYAADDRGYDVYEE